MWASKARQLETLSKLAENDWTSLVTLLQMLPRSVGDCQTKSWIASVRRASTTA